MTVKFPSLHSTLPNQWAHETWKRTWHLLTFPSLLISVLERRTLHMCGNVLDDCILCSLWEGVCVCVGSVLWRRAPAVLSICSNIPPLIDTRAPPQSSLHKELLFPLGVDLHVCVSKTSSHPRALPLILSSRLLPYRKLITDGLGSGIRLISQRADSGPLWGGDRDRTRNNKHVVHQVHLWTVHMYEIWPRGCEAVRTWPSLLIAHVKSYKLEQFHAEDCKPSVRYYQPHLIWLGLGCRSCCLSFLCHRDNAVCIFAQYRTEVTKVGLNAANLSISSLHTLTQFWPQP